MHASTFHANTQSSPNSGLPAEIQQHLGNLLKASYNDILTAPVPDRFMQLLAQFDAPSAALASNDFTPVTDSDK